MPSASPLISPLLCDCRVPHGFSTRVGGVSTPTPAADFSSLNFGNPGDLLEHRDPPANIARNFEILAQAIRATGREIVQVHQVHGPQVHVVRRGQPSHPTAHDTKADAIVTDDPSRLLAVRVADCCPILLSSSDGTVVAAVHAGWRGVVCSNESTATHSGSAASRGVLAPAVHAMQSLGARAIRAVIGPCISFDHFEVGPEVLAEFRAAFGEGCESRGLIRTLPTGKGFVNLQACLGEQLKGLGVDAVDTIARCTVAEPELFFSHRRDRGRTGRLVGIIGPRAG
ncbi:MAG: polyphenol oxidase family protein [Phycisphaerales bacterium]|nr:polyphenol oxidase family protein [Phycisphaerales bacterium]